jgi:hypothetical protein
MTDNRRLHDESSVESALRDLAPTIAYPPTPDLATSVRAALTDPEALRPPRFRWRIFRRSSLAAVAALVLLAGAALAVGIGLRGLSIVFVETPPPGASEELRLGEPVTLTEAQAEAPFRILLPSGEIGRPDEVYADSRAGVHQVTLVYRTSSGGKGVDLLITQFLARPELDAAVKQVGPGTSVEAVTVGDHQGFWIAGEPHMLTYVDPNGRLIEDRIRLVGDVLVWQEGDVTLRLEGAESREAAIQIAESME